MITPVRGWISLWRHFFNRERTCAELTASMIEWQEKWKWDFLKINPPACYHVLDWGTEYEFFPDPFREPRMIQPLIRDINNVSNFKVPESLPVLDEQIQTIRNLRAHFGPGLPIVQTVFSPIEIAHRFMTGRPMLMDLLHTAPAALDSMLERLTGVFRDHSVRCLEAGADGIFFATKWASSRYMSWQQYQRFAVPHEMEILRALRRQNAWIILHVCGDNTHLGSMLNYDVDVYSYDFFAEGAESPEKVMESTGKWVLGGIDQERLQEHPEEVITKMRTYSHLERWMAGPSCVVPPQVEDAKITQLQFAARM